MGSEMCIRDRPPTKVADKPVNRTGKRNAAAEAPAASEAPRPAAGGRGGRGGRQENFTGSEQGVLVKLESALLQESASFALAVWNVHVLTFCQQKPLAIGTLVQQTTVLVRPMMASVKIATRTACGVCLVIQTSTSHDTLISRRTQRASRYWRWPWPQLQRRRWIRRSWHARNPHCP